MFGGSIDRLSEKRVPHKRTRASYCPSRVRPLRIEGLKGRIGQKVLSLGPGN